MRGKLTPERLAAMRLRHANERLTNLTAQLRRTRRDDHKERIKLDIQQLWADVFRDRQIIGKYD